MTEKEQLTEFLNTALNLECGHVFFGDKTRKEYIAEIVDEFRTLGEIGVPRNQLDIYDKKRKPTLPKSRPHKNKKKYDRKKLPTKILGY